MQQNRIIYIVNGSISSWRVLIALNEKGLSYEQKRLYVMRCSAVLKVSFLERLHQETIAIVRKEYTEEKYHIPGEFKEDIPGFRTYQKYAEYLPDL